MPSAREIRARLARKEEDVRRQRADAVVAAGDAGKAALKAREDNNSALRSAFERALRTRDADRAAKLRAAFEAALVDDSAVLAVEVAAGRAVLAAAEFKVTQVELAEITELRVEDLRLWSQMARPAEQGAGSSGSSAASGRSALEDGPVRPAAGYAVAVEVEPSEGRAGDLGEVDVSAG